MKPKLRKWLSVRENWRLFNFCIQILTILVLIGGMIFAYCKVEDFLDIRARSIESEKFRMIDKDGRVFFGIYKEGATTTLSFPKEQE